MSDSSPPPLAGVHVVDLTWNLPGPYATFLLASLGARVTKVEPPRGDPARNQPRLFEMLHRGKQSRVLDLGTEAGREALLELIDTADVVLEGFRPGVAARLGCSAELLRARRPELIYCSISAFGQEGPLRDRPGHDLNAQALSGLAWLGRTASGRPHGLAIPAADLAAATSAVASICSALYGRAQHGGGATLDVAMIDTATSWAHLWSSGLDLAGEGESVGGVAGLARSAVLERLDRERLHALPHYEIYRCRDGRYLSIGIVDERKFWEALCRALGLGRLASLPLPARAALGPVLKPLVAVAIRRRPLAAWLERLSDLPVAPVLTPAEALEHPQIAPRLADGRGTTRAPLAGSVRLEGPAPPLGE